MYIHSVYNISQGGIAMKYESDYMEEQAALHTAEKNVRGCKNSP